MIKKLNLLSFFFLLLSCSFGDVGGFWSKEKSLDEKNSGFDQIFKNEKINEVELNEDLKISLIQYDYEKKEDSNLENDYGYVDFKNKLSKISKYKFSKINNFDILSPNLVFYQNDIIFFDNKGTVLRFNENSEIIWKLNIYTKDEKNSNPLLMLQSDEKNHLIIADNLGKYYSIDKDNGKLIWLKKHTSPFNSEIKIYDNKIYIIDSSNQINCFLLKNGNKIWSFSSEKPFVSSFSKLSLAISNDTIIFSNSIGEINALNASNGTLRWQFLNSSHSSYKEIMTLNMSPLVINENSIYFSSNKNKFYSLDFDSGAINWEQKISSSLRTVVVDRLIFTVSEKGFLNVIEKISGNIIQIKKILRNTKFNKIKDSYLTGFIIDKNHLYITTSNGRLYIYSLSEKKIINQFKIDNEKISEPFINNNNMFVIKDNAIIRIR